MPLIERLAQVNRVVALADDADERLMFAVNLTTTDATATDIARLAMPLVGNEVVGVALDTHALASKKTDKGWHTTGMIHVKMKACCLSIT